MKVLLAAAAALVAVAVFVSADVAGALAFGWAPYVGRVVPRVTVDGAALTVAAGAVALFTAGVHWLGRSWARSNEGRRWKAGWSLAMVGGVFLLFAAGICLVGVTHQVGWLLAAPEQLFVETEQYPGWHPWKSDANLKQVALGLHGGFDAYSGRSPPVTAKDGAVVHSWVTANLSYIGFSHSIDLNRPWNDPANQKHFRAPLPLFINPALVSAPRRDAAGYGLNHYAGNSRAMANGTFRPLKEFADGTANTLLIGEVNATFEPWGRPGNARDPGRGVNQSAYGFGGPPGAGGAYFGMADGSVRFIGERVSPQVLRALSTPDAADALDEDVPRPAP